MSTKLQLESENDDWSILKTLISFLYSSGGYIPEQKILTVQIADSQKEFPSLQRLNFDARFFGPLSTKLGDVFEFGTRIGYIQEGNYTREDEPIHLSRRLTQEGQNHARIISDISDSIGIDNYQRFAARQLAINGMDTPLVVALGIYYALDETGLPIDLKESQPRPYMVLTKTSDKTIKKVVEKIKECKLLDNVAIEKGENENEYSIFYEINSENVESRYNYLKLTDTLLNDVTKTYKKIGTKEAGEKILLHCCQGLDEEAQSIRQQGITELLGKYNKLPRYWLDESTEILNILERKYDDIEHEYERIFKVMEKISTLSHEFPFKTTIKIGGNYTSGELSVDEQLKGEIRSIIRGQHVWHYGLDLYIQHIPQIIDRIFLTETNYSEEDLAKTLPT